MATLCLADGLINAKNYAEAESILKEAGLINYKVNNYFLSL